MLQCYLINNLKSYLDFKLIIHVKKTQFFKKKVINFRTHI